jgi:phosphoglycolate phosphatase-like HAD superfamily hydrolase
MNKKAILIFDFDGVIADSVMVMIEIINDLAVKYGFNKIDKNKNDEFLKMGTGEMIRELEIPKKSLELVMEDIRLELTNRSGFINSVEGMVEVVNILAQRGYRMAIVTSNKKGNVKTMLKKFGIEGIKDIYAEAGLYGKDNLLNRLASDYGFNKADMVYIGDETRDIEAGRNCGIKTLGVTWGLNGRNSLLGKNPDWIVDNPRDLLEIFK